MIPNAAIEVIERAPAAADSAPVAVDRQRQQKLTLLAPAASAPPSRGSTIEIVVGREDTLRHLSLEYLNRFDDKTLAEIRALNPTIASPDRIETGQHLRLPVHLRRKSSSPAEPAAPNRARQYTRGQSMSRNFDLLQRDVAGFKPPPQAPKMETPKVYSRSLRDRHLLADDEVMKLVQRVFHLFPAQKTARGLCSVVWSFLGRRLHLGLRPCRGNAGGTRRRLGLRGGCKSSDAFAPRLFSV